MSSRLFRNWEALKTLSHASPTQRKTILRGASTDLISAICEIALNILKGRLPLTAKQKGRLKKWSKIIKSLSNRTISISKKKKLVNQSGGFLAPLLGFAIPLLTSLLTNR